jgi:AraC-like DNA-binding protein
VICFSPARQVEALRAAKAIRSVAPDHPIVGYIDPRTLSSQFILEMGRAGLTDLVLRDVDDSRAVLQRVLQNAEQHNVATRIAARMCEGMPRTVRITIQFICQHLRDELDVPGIAAGLGVSRRTLHHRLGQAGSPSASELIGWCRVVFIAHQLGVGGVSLATIATQLDVPSWRNLNYLLRRYLGTGAKQLRHPSALDETVRAFHAAFSRRPLRPMVHWAEVDAAIATS